MNSYARMERHQRTGAHEMGRNPEGILITPDSARAYVAQEGANDIAIVDLKTLTITGHISPGNGPDGMAWAVRK